MTLEEAAGRMLGALTSAGIPHMLVGGFTTNFYGIPRATKDVDIVIRLADRRQLTAVASALGSDFHFDTQVTFETLTGNVRHRAKAASVDKSIGRMGRRHYCGIRKPGQFLKPVSTTAQAPARRGFHLN